VTFDLDSRCAAAIARLHVYVDEFVIAGLARQQATEIFQRRSKAQRARRERERLKGTHSPVVKVKAR